MIPLLQRLETTGSWEMQIQELGSYLGTSTPLPDAVLRRARVDDHFASLLVLSRNQADLLERLYNAPRTRVFAQENEPQPVERSTRATVRKLAGSLLEWARNGFETASDDEYASRLETCRACPELVDAPDLTIYKLKLASEKDMRVCNLCGCVARRKARLASESCPAGRWSAASDRRQ